MFIFLTANGPLGSEVRRHDTELDGAGPSSHERRVLRLHPDAQRQDPRPGFQLRSLQVGTNRFQLVKNDKSMLPRSRRAQVAGWEIQLQQIIAEIKKLNCSQLSSSISRTMFSKIFKEEN